MCVCCVCLFKSNSCGFKLVIRYKIKCIVPLHALKAYRGSTSTSPLIPNHSPRWEWVVKPYVPPALRHANNSGAHCRRGWVGPRAFLDGSGEEKVSFPCQDSKPEPFKQQPDATPNELPRLLQIIKLFFFFCMRTSRSAKIYNKLVIHVSTTIYYYNNWTTCFDWSLEGTARGTRLNPGICLQGLTKSKESESRWPAYGPMFEHSDLVTSVRIPTAGGDRSHLHTSRPALGSYWMAIGVSFPEGTAAEAWG